ncbi:hypothetical protein, partial [Halococcus sp. IIIV-5B]|uniref:hypothetical protein n=1 Tax=Halococcus sp. IIIV-5B TaxID=2321230 RepID=UPI001F24924B
FAGIIVAKVLQKYRSCIRLNSQSSQCIVDSVILEDSDKQLGVIWVVMIDFCESGEIRVNRELNVLDKLASDVSNILAEQGIDHVLVSGYVAVLFGRARSTEDIDTLVATEALSEEEAERLGNELEDRGYCGPAMPLSSIGLMFEHNDPIRVARKDQKIPQVELQPTENIHPSFQNQRTAIVGIGDDIIRLPIVAPEVQIAYKLTMGGNTDYEDAYYLLKTYHDKLDSKLLDRSVSEYDVEGEYRELKNQAGIE